MLQKTAHRVFERKKILKTLIFGYGNADRQDDGVAWNLLHEVMQRNGLEITDDFDIECSDEANQVDYIFQLQLTPELADDLKLYDRVCFIDAHTGAVPEDVHVENVEVGFQKSPFTHHLTPSSLLAITDTINHTIPETLLVSVRGYEFGFSQSLSPKTSSLIEKAADIIMNWMKQK